MKLIVGLGNPGKKYQFTKHNIGFMCLDHYSQDNNLTLKKDNKFNGEWLRIDDYILLKPHTFMNNSGESIRKIMDYFKIEIEDVLVIYDDLDLPLANLRLREQGGNGGHNGIKSIINHIGTQEFKRVRFGIDKNPLFETANYVLSEFSKSEMDVVKKTITITKDIIDDFVNNVDFKNIMNKYNKPF
ncbi:aminoacyl-tRNA hydrolase [Candidatus Izimaplasma bacterium ZiA1]|uniref:aminoacyl-tRNA hydrolase n=1 Tax=Candidatus Izimoplasma sp. ZiA1 TaxID=2024899 RepID=UPI000BAA899D|nr:aminoacyl-tRNA hydrolase [Candidatus Izimaplasma bacterium ZiA1]